MYTHKDWPWLWSFMYLVYSAYIEMTRGMTTCTGHKHWKFIIISAQVYTSFVQKKVLTSGFFFVEFIVDCFKMFHFCPQNYRLLYWLCIIKFIVTSLVGIKDYASKLSLLCQCGMLIKFWLQQNGQNDQTVVRSEVLSHRIPF